MTTLIAALFAANLQAAEPPKPKVLTVETKNASLAQVVVFNNNLESKPRCPCANFSVLVKEPSLAGAPSISKILVTVSRPGVEDRTTVLEERTLLQRCPSSPWYSEQMSVGFMGASDATFTITAKARRCMNPTMAECRVLKTVAQSTFTIQQLRNLTQSTPEEALAAMEEAASPVVSGCQL